MKKETYHEEVNNKYVNKLGGSLNQTITDCITRTEERYRLANNDKARILYNQILDSSSPKNSDEHLTLIYNTLKAWNMGSRGAKLQDLNIFKNSITDETNWTVIERLQSKTILDLPTVCEELKSLFDRLDLTQTKTKLVTTSKTMHFLLPNLVVPIDNRYTLRFFGIENSGWSAENKRTKESEVFIGLEKAFAEFAIKNYKVLKANIHPKGFSRNIPKVIDNFIIGYCI